MSSKREQIIQAILSRMAIIRTANGFNTECGASVFRTDFHLAEGDMPFVCIWPREEDNENAYGRNNLTMNVGVNLLSAFGTGEPSVVSNQLLADIIEAMTGTQWTVPFTGGSDEIEAGDTLSGDDSAASGHVQSVIVTSGTWAGGDAAGSIVFRRKSGDFQAETVNAGAATIAGGSITGDGPVELVTNNLANEIVYVSGGQADYPEPGDVAVAVNAEFKILYRTSYGNPYA